MVELFQLIATKPLEFLAGLGVSSATIYSVLKIIKFLMSLMLKKKNIEQENLRFDKIANVVVEKFGGVENFIDKTASQLITKLAPIFEDMKGKLKEIYSKENCPVELKAYIETVLKYSGNNELLLTYEELKKQLINNIDKIKPIIEQKKVEQVMINIPVVQEVVGEVKEIASEEETKVKEITYV